MNVIFTPLKDFKDADLRSEYCVGLNYTVKDRPPSAEVEGDTGTPAEKTLLHGKLQEWLAKGMVRLGTADGASQPEAKVSGRGSVR